MNEFTLSKKHNIQHTKIVRTTPLNLFVTPELRLLFENIQQGKFQCFRVCG